MAKPSIPDIKTLIQAGINPKTGLPLKYDDGDIDLKCEVKKVLRVIDEQDAVNRYKWYNLPCNITSQELERWLYYKGQLAFFYEKTTDEFYFMPYALEGTIDFYGRYNHIHPLPMQYGDKTEMKKDSYKNVADRLSQIKLKCIYGVIQDEDVTTDTLTNSAVLLHDYTKQLSETIIARQLLNDPILDAMAECIPYQQTALLMGCGVLGYRVNDADQKDEVIDGAKTMKACALKGIPWSPVIGSLDFQEMAGGSVLKAEEFMQSLQSLDNFRLSTYGLENGGLYSKKAHMLQEEQDMNASNVGLVMQDGLSIRQNFCNIANSIWGLNIWCEPTENETMDLDGDGVMYDEDIKGKQTGIESESGNDE